VKKKKQTRKTQAGRASHPQAPLHRRPRRTIPVFYIGEDKRNKQEKQEAGWGGARL